MPPCMPLEVLNFPKFVRTYGTCMHHDKSLLHTCIVPPLISLLLGYVLLSIMTLSHESCTMLLVQMAALAGSENFLLMFGTPTLLWRVEDECIDSAASTFPQVDPSTIIWAHHNSNALI